MQSNSILNKARYSENTDEWYTAYSTVEEELSHYIPQFYEKVVLCNCDDPFESAFSKYFIMNFNTMKQTKNLAVKMEVNLKNGAIMYTLLFFQFQILELQHREFV